MARHSWTRGGLLLAASTIGLLASAGVAAAAPTLPTGGAVTAGSAAISSSGASVTISQSTPKAIIDWNSFSIGQGGSVQFNNGSGATLNRVIGNSGSAIDGMLSGTGSVYLINPGGVIVGKTGVVNVGGSFVASTLDVPNASFLSSGDLVFSGASTAAVVNEGKVGSLGGDVVLVARNVSNAGDLSAPNGTVGLLAGQSVLLRDQALNDGKFSVLVGGAASSVVNSGLVEAANAELRANGGNIYGLAGNTAGVIRATGTQEGQGHVWLVAEGGAADIEGTITARGQEGGPGTIETSAANLTIGNAAIDAGIGGTWLIDPYDLTINAAAATSISNALNVSTNVTEQTTASGASGYGVQNPSGNGDIIFQSPVSWSTEATLTLDAWRNLTITWPITVSGTGHVVLNFGSGGAGGVLSFGLKPSGFAGSINFTNAPGSGQTLLINGVDYDLIYSLAQLGGYAGSHGAIAANLTASSSYTTAVLGSYSGVLEGLGHTVSGLTINGGENSGMGLVGHLGSGGVIADLGLVGGQVIGNVDTGDLVGWNQGTVRNTFATGKVMLDDCNCDNASGVGGLVGENDGSISGSYATGEVDGTDPTDNQGRPDTTSAIGGLVGTSSGSIDRSYATGPVRAFDATSVGGLVGAVGGSISNSYATGQVEGASDVGGLVGFAFQANITSSFAMSGWVRNSDSCACGGGLVGEAHQSTITQSFATDRQGDGVYGGIRIAGFIGGDVSTDTFSADYWNTDTSGESKAGAGGAVAGVTGQTTAQLQAGLPSGFDSSVWGEIVGTSYPFQLALFGASPQVFSGHTTPGLQFAGAIINGAVSFGTAVVGRDSSYYFITPGGWIPGNSTAIVYLVGAAKGTTVVEKVPTGASLTGLDVFESHARMITPEGTYSAMISDLAKGLGPATVAAGPNMLLGISGGQLTLGTQTQELDLFLNGASFDFDGPLNVGSSRQLQIVSAGKVTQSVGGVVAGKLQGSSVRGFALTASGNQIGQLLGWSDASPVGVVSLNDGVALTVNGAVSAGGLSLTTTSGRILVSAPIQAGSRGVSLVSAGTATESGAGVVTTPGALTVQAVGGVTLNAANTAHSISLANTGGGSVSYNDVGTVTINAATNDSGVVTIASAQDSGGNGAVTVNGPLSGSKVTINAAGRVAGTGAAVVASPGSLIVTAIGGISLSGPNVVHSASLANSGGGSIGFNNVGSVTVTAATNPGGLVTLTTRQDGGGLGALTLTGAVSGSKVVLTSAGILKESGAGAITTANLTGSAAGAVTLNGANMIAALTSFSAAGGAFALTDGRTLTQSGTLDGTNQTVSLTTTAGDILVNGTVLAKTLNLVSQAGQLKESNSTGSIKVTTLNATAQTGITLASTHNQITHVGTDTTASGPNHIQQ